MRTVPRLGLLAALIAMLAIVAGGASGAPRVPGSSCPVFPRTNQWNVPVDKLPLDPRSAAIVASIGRDSKAHADFGAGLYKGAPIGIPYRFVSSKTKKVPVSFEYSDESDRGSYPVPADAPVEGGRSSDGDRHVILVDRSACRLYELYASYPKDGGKSWTAGSGAIWNLRSNKLRPRGWTSADAAGLPVFPGLARVDEVLHGHIDHALRITVPRSRRAYIYPARHYASSSTDPAMPAMGQRLRLKSSFSIASFPPQSRVILRALKRYGAIVADNGSAWYVSGAPSSKWDNDDLHSLGRVPGGAWEVVDAARLKKPH